MSYARDLAKMRSVLEEKTDELLKQITASEGTVEPLEIKYQDSEMSYAVEVAGGEAHLVLIDSQSREVLYDIEAPCVEMEELAMILDELTKRKMQNEPPYCVN